MNVTLFVKKKSKLRLFFDSFSPSSKAVLIFGIPFTLIDAIHYYTAGTTIIFSMPILFLVFAACGISAARYSISIGNSYSQAKRNGLVSGFKLWLCSTIINTCICFFAGALSIGAVFFLGIPYLLLCAPFNILLGSITGFIGANIYTFIHQRTNPVIK